MASPILPLNVANNLERGRHDIVFFAWYFLGIKLHPGQIRFLREADGLVNVLVPGNRFGKTVLIAVRHIWYNFYKVGIDRSNTNAWMKLGYRTACIAPDSKILVVDFRTITEILESRFKISKEGEPIKTNQCRIGWYLVSKVNNPNPKVLFKDNGSIEFYSTSDDKGTKLQGDFYGYASYDEGGRSHHLYLELNQNIGQRLSQMGAPLDLVSTPAMDSPSLTYHHEIFQKGLRREGGFRSFEGSAYENVYLPTHYFEREELRLAGDPLREQVLEGKFVFSGATLYNQEDIERAKTDSLNGGVRHRKGMNYIVSTDTAVGSDEMVFTVLEVPPDFDITNPDSPKVRLVRQIAFKGNSRSPQVAMQDYLDLWEHYNKERKARGIVETFNEGSMRWFLDLPTAVARRTKAYGSGLQTKSKIGVQGKSQPTTNGGKKVDMLISLRKLLTAGLIQLPSDNKELLNQVTMYREDDKKLATDRIISLALACWMVVEAKPPAPVAKVITINW